MLRGARCTHNHEICGPLFPVTSQAATDETHNTDPKTICTTMVLSVPSESTDWRYKYLFVLLNIKMKSWKSLFLLIHTLMGN